MTITSTQERRLWTLRMRPTPAARLRLYCIPHAGAGASTYSAMALAAPPDLELIALQLPGREWRCDEVMPDTLDALVTALDQAVGPALEPPYAIFGHSMGAAICHAWVRRLAARAAVLPRRLFVSGRAAPHRVRPRPQVHALPDAQLIDVMATVYQGGLPAALRAEPDLLAHYLSVLRADFRALEGHDGTCDPLVPVPITAFGGSDDPLVAPSDLEGWRQCTPHETRVHLYAGGHLFLKQHASQMLRTICAECAA